MDRILHSNWHKPCKAFCEMKLPLNWQPWIIALQALTVPGISPLMALVPLLGMAGGVLMALRKMFP